MFTACPCCQDLFEKVTDLVDLCPKCQDEINMDLDLEAMVATIPGSSPTVPCPPPGWFCEECKVETSFESIRFTGWGIPLCPNCSNITQEGANHVHG